MHRKDTQPHRDELHRWLHAEATGDDDGAEQALASLFTALPQPVPSGDFADRVMAAVTTVGTPVATPLFKPIPAARRAPARWLQAAIAACLALVGIGCAFMPSIGLALGRSIRPAELLTALAHGFVAAADWVSAGLAAFRAVAGVRTAALEAIANPPVLVVLLGLLLLTVLTFRGLTELLATERSPGHAPSI